MRGVKPGTFNAADAILDGQQWGGGVIRRPQFVASALNSTRVNRRGPGQLPDAQADMYGEVNFGFAGRAAAVNRVPQFQYVQGDAYKGVLPWEVMNEIQARKPWE